MSNLKHSQQYSKKRQIRMMLVMIVYKFELFDEKINLNQLFETDEILEFFNYRKIIKNFNEPMKILKIIEKNYDNFKIMISKYIRQDWTWIRINPITRAILLCASSELWRLDIGIVTNEYVDIAKDFIPESNEYKFINLVIDKIGKIYYEHKNKKN